MKPTSASEPAAENCSQVPSATVRGTEVERNGLNRTQAVLATLQNIRKRSVHATPHPQNPGRATALDLNIVSASCVESEFGCDTMQLSEPGACDNAHEHSIVPAPHLETEKSRDVATADRINQVRGYSATTCTIGTQAGTQVESQGCQIKPCNPCGGSVHMGNMQSEPKQHDHVPRGRIEGMEVSNKLEDADQCFACAPMSAAAGQSSPVSKGGTITSTAALCPRQPCADQPAASNYQRTFGSQQTQGHGQSDAATQTPHRQPPKRKLPTKNESAAVPVARRRLECSPVQSPGSFRAPSAAWARSPVAQRIAYSPGTRNNTVLTMTVSVCHFGAASPPQ